MPKKTRLLDRRRAEAPLRRWFQAKKLSVFDQDRLIDRTLDKLNGERTHQTKKYLLKTARSVLIDELRKLGRAALGGTAQPPPGRCSACAEFLRSRNQPVVLETWREFFELHQRWLERFAFEEASKLERAARDVERRIIASAGAGVSAETLHQMLQRRATTWMGEYALHQRWDRLGDRALPSREDAVARTIAEADPRELAGLAAILLEQLPPSTRAQFRERLARATAPGIGDLSAAIESELLARVDSTRTARAVLHVLGIREPAEADHLLGLMSDDQLRGVVAQAISAMGVPLLAHLSGYQLEPELIPSIDDRKEQSPAMSLVRFVIGRGGGRAFVRIRLVLAARARPAKHVEEYLKIYQRYFLGDSYTEIARSLGVRSPTSKDEARLRSAKRRADRYLSRRPDARFELRRRREAGAVTASPNSALQS